MRMDKVKTQADIEDMLSQVNQEIIDADKEYRDCTNLKIVKKTLRWALEEIEDDDLLCPIDDF